MGAENPFRSLFLYLEFDTKALVITLAGQRSCCSPMHEARPSQQPGWAISPILVIRLSNLQFLLIASPGRLVSLAVELKEQSESDL
jgi:hypothetical protein